MTKCALTPIAQAAGLDPSSTIDGQDLRQQITLSIRACPKSREQIADEMSVLTGERITKRMLNSYTSDAADQNRFPAQYVRAFCLAVEDHTVLRLITERAGFRLITKAEEKFYELGRQIIAQKRAADAIAKLEGELAGVAL